MAPDVDNLAETLAKRQAQFTPGNYLYKVYESAIAFAEQVPGAIPSLKLIIDATEREIANFNAKDLLEGSLTSLEKCLDQALTSRLNAAGTAGFQGQSKKLQNEVGVEEGSSAGGAGYGPVKRDPDELIQEAQELFKEIRHSEKEDEEFLRQLEAELKGKDQVLEDAKAAAVKATTQFYMMSLTLLATYGLLAQWCLELLEKIVKNAGQLEREAMADRLKEILAFLARMLPFHAGEGFELYQTLNNIRTVLKRKYKNADEVVNIAETTRDALVSWVFLSLFVLQHFPVWLRKVRSHASFFDGLSSMISRN